MYRWQSLTMGNIVATFGEVLRQVWESWRDFRILDIRWKYNRKGF